MKSPRYADYEFAPMAPGETATPIRRERPKYTEAQSRANDYPAGSVPKETGWQSREGSISKLSGHNKITVCRGRKPNGY